MKRILAASAVVLLAATVPVTASAKGAIEGRWKNPKGSVVVKVAPCGNAYCGTVVDASDKAKATARKGGTSSLVGTRILSGVKPAGADTFRGGVRSQAQHPRSGDDPPDRPRHPVGEGLRDRRADLQGAALDAHRLAGHALFGQPRH